MLKYGKRKRAYPTSTRRKKTRRVIRGRGGYKSFLKYAARGIGGLAGAGMGLMRGGLPGAVMGARTGWGAGRAFSKWAGWGDYGPLVTNKIMSGNPAGNSNTSISVNPHNKTGDIIISNTEFVKNIVCKVAANSVSTFQCEALELNAGLSHVFPFLSNLALNYDLYEFQGLVFQYKPTSGETGSNNSNAIGKVIMATNYDPEAPKFQTSIEMENYDYASSAKPSQGQLHGVETAVSQMATRMKFVRTGVSQKDRIFTDYGVLNIASEGIPGSSIGGEVVIGELWVSYRVRLSRSNLDGHKLGQAKYARITCEGTGAYNASFNSGGSNFWRFYSIDKQSTLGAKVVLNRNWSDDFKTPITTDPGARTQFAELVFPKDVYDSYFQVRFVWYSPVGGEAGSGLKNFVWSLTNLNDITFFEKVIEGLETHYEGREMIFLSGTTDVYDPGYAPLPDGTKDIIAAWVTQQTILIHVKSPGEEVGRLGICFRHPLKAVTGHPEGNPYLPYNVRFHIEIIQVPQLSCETKDLMINPAILDYGIGNTE